ncbi:MAG: protein translocase subunit SecF [Nannocystis sp.]|nr:protein translocase subunit SecF [Nannocystis sp.]MBA3545176.1 protein translocase subunit SecF [Nannocystis sp.]
MKFFEIIPPGTRFPFIRSAKYFIFGSMLLLLGTVGAMVFNATTRGSVLNFGIDFAGGSSVRLALAADKPIPIEDVRTALEKAGYGGVSAVTEPDAVNQVMVHVKDVASIDDAQAETCKAALAEYPQAKLKRWNYTSGASKIFMLFDAQPTYSELEELLVRAGCDGRVDKGTGKLGEFPVELALIGIGAKIKDDLDTAFGAGTVEEIVSSETVGAKVGNQLKNDGIKSLLYAIGFIFLYVMLRFDLRYAPGGILALTHDALITVGAFALSWKEFNLQTVAALLTIIGYSINDTIVVFDRIRERITLFRDQPVDEAADTALNETLSRTILTSGTTLLVVIATWSLGSGPIKDFAFALFIGITIGTYSSLFIATPVFLWVNKRFYGGQALAPEPEEGTGTLLGSANNAEVDEATGQTVGDIRADAIAARAKTTETGDAGGDDEGGEGGEQKASRRRRRQRPSS